MRLGSIPILAVLKYVPGKLVCMLSEINFFGRQDSSMLTSPIAGGIQK